MNANKLKRISDLMGEHFFRIENACDEEQLNGKTFISITGAEEDSEQIVFECDDGDVYVMYHEQDCCEDVRICDVAGDISTILNRPVVFHSTTNDEKTSLIGARDAYDESYTWTFYHFRTIKGYVDIRWYGTSNGYYSESVDLLHISKDELL